MMQTAQVITPFSKTRASKFFGGQSLQWCKVHWYLLALLFLGYGILQGVYFWGAKTEYQEQVLHSVLVVENRVSLDLALVPLPNVQLNVAGNSGQVSWYLSRLNEQLGGLSFPIRVTSLHGINSHANPEMEFAKIIRRTLRGPDQTVELLIGVHPFPLNRALSLFPFALALLITILAQRLWRTEPQDNTPAGQLAAWQPVLKLNLKQKCLELEGTDVHVVMANKPMCFYAALIEYCSKYPHAQLCQHRPFPEELLAMADQVYLRLITLGHPIRRRPDFEANPEKMLSEIRAALDELFAQWPEWKARYYPPKALGEGSRSKLHNFALPDMNKSCWSIDGL